MKRITMKDIARKAGVTQQTVSQILNNYKISMVGKATQERVLKIARDLKYEPNHYARSLKLGKTNCIGISTLTGGSNFLQQFNNPYLGSVYAGIGQVLGEHGIKLVFQEVKTRNDSIELAQKRMVDGMIFVLFVEAMENFEQIKAEVLPHLNIPYVVVHSLQRDMGCHNVGVDFVRAGFKATEHLIGHGYRSVGCVRHTVSIMFMENLYQGYQRALAEHGLPFDEHMVFTADGSEIKTGYRLAARLLAEKRALPRALFVLDDFTCFGMIKKFREAGVRVPEDIALETFEDEYLEIDNIYDVTALVQPGNAKGRKAAEMLLDLTKTPDEKKEFKQLVLDVPLVLRKTCGCSMPDTLKKTN